MIVDDHPHLSLSVLLNRARAPLELISGAEYLFYTENGRSALYQGLKLLEPGGKETILVPSYNCGSEVEPIRRSGYRVAYYSIDRSCRPDIGEIEGLINGKTLAVMVTHFNGFPQPIEDIKQVCSKKGVYLIEDCAHVLHSGLNGKRLGSFGDIAVFSPRKYLPIPNGGLLAVNNRSIGMRGRQAGGKNSRVARDAASVLKGMIKHNLKAGRNGRGQDPGLTGSKGLQQGESVEIHDFHEENYDRGISPVSKYILERSDLGDVIKKRRRNYSLIYERLTDLKGLKGLSGSLPEDVCPLHYLALTEDPWRLRGFLLTKNVETIVFWSFFHRDFPFGTQPDSEYLKRHVLAFPVHQNLTPSDMDYMAGMARSYFEND